MANKRIVDLPMAESINDEDILHIIQDGVDKQASASHVSGKVKDVQNRDGETLVNEDGVAIVKSETISGTRSEIDAMILSGEIKDGDNYIVTDEDGIYQPSDLNEIRTDVEQLKQKGSVEYIGGKSGKGTNTYTVDSDFFPSRRFITAHMTIGGSNLIYDTMFLLTANLTTGKQARMSYNNGSTTYYAIVKRVSDTQWSVEVSHDGVDCYVYAIK